MAKGSYKVYFKGNNAGDHRTREAAEKRARRIVSMSHGRVKREEIDIRYEPDVRKNPADGDPYNTAPSKPDPWQQEKVKKDRRRRGNPSKATVIYARKRIQGKLLGEWLWFDGKKFTNNNVPHYFGTRERAKALARDLKRKFRVLDKYRLYVGAPNKLLANARRKNPSWPDEQSQLDEAARRLYDFSGHAARRVVKVRSRSSQQTGLIVGELDLIGYRVKREGIDGGKLVKYEHDFSKGSRPLLAVSSDGKQLHIVGGRYEFTEAGIEDR